MFSVVRRINKFKIGNSILMQCEKKYSKAKKCEIFMHKNLDFQNFYASNDEYFSLKEKIKQFNLEKEYIKNLNRDNTTSKSYLEKMNSINKEIKDSEIRLKEIIAESDKNFSDVAKDQKILDEDENGFHPLPYEIKNFVIKRKCDKILENNFYVKPFTKTWYQVKLHKFNNMESGEKMAMFGTGLLLILIYRIQ